MTIVHCSEWDESANEIFRVCGVVIWYIDEATTVIWYFDLGTLW